MTNEEIKARAKELQKNVEELKNEVLSLLPYIRDILADLAKVESETGALAFEAKYGELLDNLKYINLE